MAGISMAPTKSNMPCTIVDSLDLAPAFMLAEDRTITEVIGIPPISPLIILPVPCASNSLLLSVNLFPDRSCQ